MKWLLSASLLGGLCISQLPGAMKVRTLHLQGQPSQAVWQAVLDPNATVEMELMSPPPPGMSVIAEGRSITIGYDGDGPAGTHVIEMQVFAQVPNPVPDWQGGALQVEQQVQLEVYILPSDTAPFLNGPIDILAQPY